MPPLGKQRMGVTLSRTNADWKKVWTGYLSEKLRLSGAKRKKELVSKWVSVLQEWLGIELASFLICVFIGSLTVAYTYNNLNVVEISIYLIAQLIIVHTACQKQHNQVNIMKNLNTIA